MPTANIAVSGSTNDAVELAGTVTLNGPSINLNNAVAWGGFRFQSVAIAVGSTINSAYIEIERGGTASVNVVIYGEDVDDSATFAATSSNISNRTRTSASVTWNAALGGSSGSRFDSPAITAIIQEIVDRGGWASGNDISILFDCAGGGIAIRSYDNAAGDAAVLKLNWTETNQPPEVTLNTADASSVPSLPTLAFTGTDINSDTIRYQIQISDSLAWEAGTHLRDNIDYLVTPVGGFHPNPMPSTLTWEGEYQVDDRFGQSFTASGGILDKIVMPISIDEADTDGTAIVRLYGHQGVYGVSSAPLNAADPEDTPTPGWLAISEAVHIDVVNGPVGWLEFEFTGANRIHLVGGEYYMLMADWRATSPLYTNTIEFDADVTPTHSGNAYVDGAGANNGPFLAGDVKFAVFEESILVTALSGTNDGFTGTPDNTDPYTSAQQVSYTVQPDDNLTLGVTYFWRVRAIDPSGSNSYGDWSTIREFTVTSEAIGADFISSGETLYQPTITVGSVTVSPNLISSVATVYAPIVSTPPTIRPAFIASTETVYQPAILPGSVTISLDVIVSGGVVYVPAILSVAGAVIVPNFITSTAGVYSFVIANYIINTERIYPIRHESRVMVIEA